MGEIGIAIRMTLVTLVLTGFFYPAAVTAVAKVIFPGQAEGRLVRDDAGNVVGSALIGQGFTKPGYLQGRPSAAGAGYDAAASSGSNLGPTSKALRDRVEKDLARLETENPDAPRPVPLALVTTSASGLDPHLPPDAAFWQAPRIAKARGVEVDRVRAVIEEQVEERTLLVLGEVRVNVLAVNLALDRRFGRMAD